MTSEQLFYARRFQEGRKQAGRAVAYYESAIEREILMVFQRYGGRKLPCIISKDGGDKFTVLVDGKRQVVWKTSLQYAYKARSQGEVEQVIFIDERVKGQNLEPVLPKAERYQIPDAELLACIKERHALRLTMRGGEVIEGRVEWFGAFDIKMELSTGRSVVVFRHAVYEHKVLPKA